MLSTAAFNALLKIVEEPPEHLIFILATTEQDKVPPTILSRCQRFSFRRLSQEDISGRIRYVAYQEGIDLLPEAAELLARLADGALRDGLSLLDQCASATPGTLDIQAVTACLGLAGRQAVYEMMQKIGNRDTASSLALFTSLFEQGKDLRSLLNELCSAARDLLILKEVPEGNLPLVSGLCSEEELRALSSLFSRGELLRMVSLLQELLAGRAKSLNLRVDAELCLIRLCNPALQNDMDSFTARLTRIEESLASGVLPSAVPPAEESLPPREAPAENTEDTEKAEKEEKPSKASLPPKEESVGPEDFWPELCAALRQELLPPARGFFSGSLLKYRLEGENLQILGGRFELDMLNRQDIPVIIARKASAILGRPIRVSFREIGLGPVGKEDPLDSILSLQKELGSKMTVR